MRQLILVAAIIGGGFAIQSGAALALDKKGMAPVATKPTKMAPTNLSESECTKLGGTVSSETSGICNSGRFCSTVDENQQKHVVCISKK